MKNLYSKRSSSSTRSTKKKVHPTSAGDALGALELLPAALLSLAASLPARDKEVLAYLISRSLAPAWELPHSHLPGCGCFDCYTRFWTRWDSSPHRELIHQVIDAFEDHLASSEARPARKNRREKGRRRPAEAVAVVEEEEDDAEERESGSGEAAAAVEEERVGEEGGGGNGERRRSTWPDVMGILNLRFWSLWSSA